jgi:uncharacterized membrane protein
MGTEENFVSDLSGKVFSLQEKVSANTIRQSILGRIQKDHPEFGLHCFLAETELNEYRELYISDYLAKQVGELTALERTVLDSLSGQTLLSDKIDAEEEEPSTFGQRVADKVASFGGSWTFIISFLIFLLLWIGFNFFWLSNRGFDPYPFILLNLILSSIAALQAPVIMMSQNRQEEKDRERARKDYMVNLKSELEIRMLHEKIDHLIIRQQQELLEMQKVQHEVLDALVKKLGN